nr:hypothetical protein [Candidimonas sp. SYP-B2681]
MRDVVDAQADKVAASKLPVDSQVEHDEVAQVASVPLRCGHYRLRYQPMYWGAFEQAKK